MAETKGQKFIALQFYSWEKPQMFDPGNLKINPGDWVIVSVEGAEEISRIIDLGYIKPEELKEPLGKVLRVAELTDLEKLKIQQQGKTEAIKICKQFIRKHDLPMKLVDCFFSFDGAKLTFAFTSDTRVDFRDLVKDLLRHFKKNIRLQQIGIRDELKQAAGIGPCGRTYCCSLFLKDLGNITTDLARLQNIEHRGSERLSGACGRLKCCLSYEAVGYQEMSSKLPPLGSKIRTQKGETGEVICWHILRHSVNVRIDRETVTEEFFGCQKMQCQGCSSKKYCQNK